MGDLLKKYMLHAEKCLVNCEGIIQHSSSRTYYKVVWHVGPLNCPAFTNLLLSWVVSTIEPTC